MDYKLTSAKIFFEDGHRYMELKYERVTDCGDKVTYIYPKVSFPFSETDRPDMYFVYGEPYLELIDHCPLYKRYSKEARDCGCDKESNFYIIHTPAPKKKMTKKEIEKALGYAIEIID